MAIFVDKNTKVIYQGGTGKQGQFHMLRNKAYGTNVVAAINPKKAGENVEGVPVVGSVADAKAQFGANVSCVFVPPPAVKGAVLEAAEAGMDLIVVITEGVPMHDEAEFYNTLVQQYPNTRLLGPNCPGLITPGECNIGITPGEIATPGGPVAIVSRSGTLTYQALYELSQQGIGVTTCVGIGGDPVPGTNFVDCLAAFQADAETKAVIMIGEIGGAEEEKAAAYIGEFMDKPVASYIAGQTAPEGKKMGHAGAITSGNVGTAKGKMEALAAAGVRVAKNPTEAGEFMVDIVKAL